MNTVLSVLRVAFYAAYAVVYVGFLFHRSDEPTIFWYSRNYCIALVMALLPFLVPTALAFVRRRAGTKKMLLALTPAVVLCGLAYVVAHYFFDYTREYPFDPYLQAPTQALEEQYGIQRPANAFRVLALGGSTTRNAMLPADKRYSAVLEDLLAERYPGVEVQVLNAGQNWWATKHSLINYMTYAEQWEPDVVVVMHAINDLGKSFSHPAFAIGEFNERWTHHYAQARDAAHSITFEQYVARGLGVRLLGSWFSELRIKHVDFPLDFYRSHEQFRANLGRLARYVSVDDPTIIFVTQPFMYKAEMPAAELKTLYGHREFKEVGGFLTEDRASTESLARAMAAFNETTRRVAESHPVLLADAAPRVPKNLEYFRDEVHYTPLGAATLAQTIADVIFDNGLVEGESSGHP